MLSIPLIQLGNPIQNCIAQPSNGVSSQYVITPSNVNCYVPYVSCPVCSVCIPKMDNNVPILNQNSTQDFPQQIKDHLKDIISNLQEKDFEKQKQELLFWVNNINVSKDSSLNKKNRRIHFNQFEDDKIKELVDRYGTNNWPLVSTFIHGRTPKQCRDRYFNYLMPGIFHGEWTKEEDEMLMKLYKEYGSKWTIIQNYIPNRSSNSIKNRWHIFLHKRYEKECHQSDHPISENEKKSSEKISKPDKNTNETNDQVFKSDIFSEINSDDWFLLG